MRSSIPAALAVALVLCPGARPASAHGIVGQRFFPATLAIDDPFVADELSLPTVLHIKTPDGVQTSIAGELSKRLTPDLAVSVAGTFLSLSPEGAPHESGFDNMEVAAKYVFLKSAPHEALVSAGLGWDVGGTGSKDVGAESFSAFTSALFFGKGFGDLPDGAGLLKPLALTGTFGVAVPTRNATFVSGEDEFGNPTVEREVNAKVAEWGFALMYNLQYLQSHVKDVGLGAPFNRLIPLVEFALETPLNGPESGETTGTANPGLIWFGRFFQVGVEAAIPLNRQTGKNVGVLGQLHFYLDDIAPSIFSRTPFHGVLGPTQAR